MTLVTTNLTDSSGTPVLSGAWHLIETQVASASATIDVINLTSAYYMYKFFWNDVQPVSDNVNFTLRTSSDNGSSWDAGASDYAFGYHYVSMATSPTHAVVGDNAQTRIVFINSLGNATNEFTSIELTCFNPSSTEYTKFKWEAFRLNQSTVGFHHVGASVRLSAAAVNGVQFSFNTGNIAVGTLKVYGVVA